MTAIEYQAAPPPAEAVAMETAGANHRKGEIALRAVGITLAAGAMTALPLIGALHSMETSPSHVDLAPGLSLDIQARPGDMSTIDLLGAIGSIGNRRWHGTIPLLGSTIGADIRLEPVQIQGDMQHATALYGALATDPTRTVIGPLKHALIKKAVSGAAMGFGADAAAGIAVFAGMRLRKRRQVHAAALRNSLGQLEETVQQESPDSQPLRQALASVRQHSEAAEPRRLSATRRHLYAFTLIAALAGSGGAEAAVLHHELQPAQNQCFEPIDGTVLSSVPAALKGSEVCGTSARLAINNGWDQVQYLKNDIDTFWDKRVAANITAAVLPWRKNAANLKLLDDPANTVFLDISDVHCSFPFLSHTLPQMVREIQPAGIINTGDTMTSAGTMPFEPLCISSFKSALTAHNPNSKHGVTPMVVNLGNHDAENTTGQLLEHLSVKGTDGKQYHPATVLMGKHETAKVDGILFVGGTDPRISVSGKPIALRTAPNKPLDAQQERLALYNAGIGLAKVACQAAADNSLLPVVLVHAKEEGYQAMKQGCVGTELSGHYHLPSGPATYTAPDGTDTLVYTQGTSSGVNDETLTIYDKASRIAPTSIFVMNRYTNRVVAYSTLTIQPDGSVALPPLQTTTPKVFTANQVSRFMVAFAGSEQPAVKPANALQP